MTFFKKDETKPSYKSAVADYRTAAGDLFIEPSQKHSTFKRGSWMLFDSENTLICIVGNQGPVFAKGIAVQMQRLAESFAERQPGGR